MSCGCKGEILIICCVQSTHIPASHMPTYPHSHIPTHPLMHILHPILRIFSNCVGISCRRMTPTTPPTYFFSQFACHMILLILAPVYHVTPYPLSTQGTIFVFKVILAYPTQTTHILMTNPRISSSLVYTNDNYYLMSDMHQQTKGKF
jgi:hypothetical protein